MNRVYTSSVFSNKQIPRSEHPVLDTERHEYEDEDDDVPEDEQGLAGDEVGQELLGERVELVTGADEDEGREEDVEDGVVGNEDQDPVGVGTEPDVILGYHHLDVEATNPGEEAGVARPDEAGHVPQQDEADDGEEGDVGVDLVAVHLVPERVKSVST